MYKGGYFLRNLGQRALPKSPETIRSPHALSPRGFKSPIRSIIPAAARKLTFASPQIPPRKLLSIEDTSQNKKEPILLNNSKTIPKILITESGPSVKSLNAPPVFQKFLSLPNYLPCVDTPNRSSIMRNGIGTPRAKKIIGKGSYGTVIEAIYKGNKVAVKTISISRRNCRLSLHQEEQAVGLSHENIVQVIDVIFPEKPIGCGIVIMELCENSVSLQHAVDNHIFNEIYTERYLLDIAHALQYIHEQNILHLDVKPGNILVTKENRCKLCDFGSSLNLKKVTNRCTKSFFQQGTVRYMAPEILAGALDAPSCSSDIYSLGIVMWFLEYRCEPYYEHQNLSDAHFIVYQVVKQQLRPSMTTNITRRKSNRKLSYLYQKCWAHNPRDRPNINEIIAKLKSMNKVEIGIVVSG